MKTWTREKRTARDMIWQACADAGDGNVSAGAVVMAGRVSKAGGSLGHISLRCIATQSAAEGRSIGVHQIIPVAVAFALPVACLARIDVPVGKVVRLDPLLKPRGPRG